MGSEDIGCIVSADVEVGKDGKQHQGLGAKMIQE